MNPSINASTEAPVYGLSGVSVVAVGTAAVVELLSRLLRDQGADVQRLVRNTEDARHLRRRGWRASATPSLELGTAAELAELLAQADVWIDGTGSDWPIRAARQLQRRHQVVCSLVSFPFAKANANGNAPDESIVAATVGLYRAARNDAPTVEQLPLASAYAAATAAAFITAALMLVADGQEAPDFTVSLFGSAILTMSSRVLQINGSTVRSEPRLPIMEIYKCADERFLQCHGATTDYVEILCRALGHPEWIDEAIHTFLDGGGDESKQVWRERFAACFSSKSAIDWESHIAALGGAATVCRTATEWRQSDHARQTGLVDKADSDDTVTSQPPAVRVMTRSTIRSKQWTAARTAPVSPREMQAGKVVSPLDGLRVVDFCIVLAGPTCGRSLAELGADVIKVDSPAREIVPWTWLDLSRGKRSLLVDLKRREGLEIAHRIVSTADVLIENFRVGRMASLGLGFDTVHAINPKLIYVSMNAFDFGGEWSHRPGWEHNAQAITGMQIERAVAELPQQVPVPANDYCTGLLATFGVLAALRERSRTGLGSLVQASLSRSALYLKSLSGAPEIGALTRIVKCADGWVVVPAASDVSSGLAAHRSTNDVITQLARDGQQAAVVSSGEDLSKVAWIRDAGLIREWVQPELGRIQQVFAEMNLRDSVSPHGWPAPLQGADTRIVLNEIGYDDDAINALRDNGVVSERIPFHF